MQLQLTVAIDERRQARQRLRRGRRALTVSDQAIAAVAMARRVVTSHFFQNAYRIAIYWPADGEISPLPLADRALAMGKQVYLPELPRKPSQRMRFAPLAGDVRFSLNRFGIPEVDVGYRETLSVNQLDLLVLPVVGMDLLGNRIGMGAGYYDRVLENCYSRAITPTLLGVAHSLQLLDAIEVQRWDIPLHWLATDLNVFAAGGC
ncbi:MAG: 5-formyltetrahydrofolate cyclo-ligase [Immundisolibacteraceae bacterium]|nr:5-formyltetrahydrofolate cyclo-ligase [Immundisolibacteraceae bacterium]